ncbi:phosphoadenosine phosphosulfate reductase family protein [Chloroflexota bacterium]
MTDNTWITEQGFVRKESDRDVYAAALDRIRHCFDLANRVTVSFSGGKDSTVLLHLTLTVARERNRLPLELWYFDDELVDPDTVAYIEEVAAWPEINLKAYGPTGPRAAAVHKRRKHRQSQNRRAAHPADIC